jgi:DNA-binding NarL/FixJ family response regulator
MDQIRILLANDHPIVRTGLRSLLERDPQIKVVGEAANGREALMLAEYQNPDIAILDVKLSLVRCLDVARAVCAMKPKRRVLILGELTDEGYVLEAFHAGATGYVLSDEVQTDLPQAIGVLTSGGVYLSPLVSRAVMESAPMTEPRQRLFASLAEGRPEAEIAGMLAFSR